jgi:hypothetical protein
VKNNEAQRRPEMDDHKSNAADKTGTQREEAIDDLPVEALPEDELAQVKGGAINIKQTVVTDQIGRE